MIVLLRNLPWLVSMLPSVLVIGWWMWREHRIVKAGWVE